VFTSSRSLRASLQSKKLKQTLLPRLLPFA
jgi:hypothetical protein